jgi:hypothetical protein
MFLFPESPLEIPLQRSPAEVIAALDEFLVPSSWSKPFTDKLVGEAAEGRIVIWRSPVFRRNDFRPVFRGKIDDDGRTIRGMFRLTLYARGFLICWVAGVAFFMLRDEVGGTLIDSLDQGHLLNLGVILGMMAFGVALPWLGWWWGREDMVRIETALRAASAGRPLGPLN